jgi:hypothetical protein
VLLAQLAQALEQVLRQQELALEQVLRQQELALVQELEQERALRQQELAQAQVPAQLVLAQQHHSQPPRQQSLFQRAQCHLPAHEFPSAFRQSVMALQCLLCLLTPRTVVRQLLQHHPHF